VPVTRSSALGSEAAQRIPLLTKDELVEDQKRHPPFGTNLTFELERYTHVHQTSGTTGVPLKVLDTTEDWAWWRTGLARTFRAAGIGPGDRVALAFSFGPHVQFWAAKEGLEEVGAMALPLGGMTSVQRMQTMATLEVTALMCTPTYALRPRRGGPGAEARPCAPNRAPGDLHRRTGRFSPRGAIPHRGGVRVDMPRPCRSDRGRTVRIPVPGGRRYARRRGRVRLRDPRSRSAIDRTRRARRTGSHSARSLRVPGAPLQNGRHRRERRQELSSRTRRPVAARWDRGTHGRHGDHPGDERVPDGGRGSRQASHRIR
jgi:hypothetical protein